MIEINPTILIIEEDKNKKDMSEIIKEIGDNDETTI